MFFLIYQFKRYIQEERILLIRKLLHTITAAAASICMLAGTAFAVESDVENYNQKVYEKARTDETALAVCLETADTYTGPWGTIEGFTYDDPTDVIAETAKKAVFFCDTEKEKADAIHDWISEEIAYDGDSDCNESASGQDLSPLAVYYEGKSSCEGYSNLMAAMLREVGIPAKKVFGYALGEGVPKEWPQKILDQNNKPVLSANHTWTEAYFDNEWHIYDVAWDCKEGNSLGVLSSEEYKDISLAEFSEDHLILDNGDSSIPSKEIYEERKFNDLKDSSVDVLEKVKENNRSKHEYARDDSTALAVCSETADTYTGPWEDVSMDAFTYEDPDNKIFDLAYKLTANCNDDESKAEAIHNWIAENISYDKDMFYSSTRRQEDSEPLVVLERGRGICTGYSKLMAAMLREVGIPAKIVSGYALCDGEPSTWQANMFSIGQGPDINHTWTEAYFDNAWHSYDVTWDSKNVYENGEIKKAPFKSDYCNISTTELSNDHYIIENYDNAIPEKTEYQKRKTQVEHINTVKKLNQKIASMTNTEMRSCLAGQAVGVIQKLPESAGNAIYNKAGYADCRADQTKVCIILNGFDYELTGYKIDGESYFHIRDIAEMLKGTDKQFNVIWDEDDFSLRLISNEEYAPVEKDVDKIIYSTGKYVTPATEKDGEYIYLGCYKIGGSNYYTLNDIGRTFNFRVTKIDESIEINTELPCIDLI